MCSIDYEFQMHKRLSISYLLRSVSLSVLKKK